MNKKCILIPTPGQTEQEYLAQHLMQHCLAFCIGQEKFNLQSALSLASTFPYQTADFEPRDNKLSKIISDLVEKKI